MKFIVAAVLLAVVAVCSAVTDDQAYEDHVKHQQTLRTARQQCQVSENVSDDEVRNFSLENTPEKLKCFSKCVFGKLDIFDETTGFKADKTVDRFRAAMNAKTDRIIGQIREKVNKCVEPKLENENACGWAHRGFVCFTKEGLTLG